MAGKLGCVIPKIDPDRYLMAFDYIRRLDDGSLPPVKTSGGRLNLIPAGKWYILLNDEVGDCVFAGIYHEILVNYVMSTGKLPPWTEAQITACVKQMYMTVTGWDGKIPPDSTDQGTDPTVAYDYWKNTGMLLPDGTRDKIEFYLVVDLQNSQGVTCLDDKTWEKIEWLLEYFSGGGFCFSVSQEAVKQFDAGLPWTIDSNSASSPIEGGHYVYQVEQVDNTDQDCITWAKAQQMTRQFMTYYGGLILFPVSKKMLDAAGQTPEGLDWNAILADYQVIQNGGVTPPAPAVTSITISPATAIVAVGETAQLKAVDNNGNDITSTCNWQSANEGMATVQQGLVTGVGAGQVKILAEDGTVSGSASLDVTQTGGRFQAGNSVAMVDGKTVTMPVPARMSNDLDAGGNRHLMVPLSVLKKITGWDPATQTATTN